MKGVWNIKERHDQNVLIFLSWSMMSVLACQSSSVPVNVMVVDLVPECLLLTPWLCDTTDLDDRTAGGDRYRTAEALSLRQIKVHN